MTGSSWTGGSALWDAVAIVAGENEAAVDRALKRIRVRYQEPVLDFHTAKDNLILVHSGGELAVPVSLWGRTTAGTCVPARPVRTGMWDRIPGLLRPGGGGELYTPRPSRP